MNTLERKKCNMLKDKKLFLLDIDGTIALGNKVIEGTFELLDYILSIDGKYIFITNNSSKSINSYVDIFKRLGFKVDESNFITASYATGVYLRKKYKDKKIFVLGTKSFVEEMKGFNLTITEELEDDIVCSVVAYDNELTYKKIENICELLITNPDIEYIATNPDLVCPVSFGYIPDCGSLCTMIENATKKKPFYIGKPNSFIIDICLKKYKFTAEETIIIGDRIYTDILCGINMNIDTCLVLTGEAEKNDLINSKFDPTYVFHSVKSIYESLKKLN